MSELKIATPDQIRGLREGELWEEPRPVTLPKCGLTFLIRRPTKRYWMERRASWPAEMIARLDAIARDEAGAELIPDDIRVWLKARAKMENAALVDPPAAEAPNFSQIAIRWLFDEDQEFLHKYLGGEVDAGNVLRATFCGSESGDAADGGNSGAGIPPPSDRTVATAGVGVAR